MDEGKYYTVLPVGGGWRILGEGAGHLRTGFVKDLEGNQTQTSSIIPEGEVETLFVDLDRPYLSVDDDLIVVRESLVCGL